MSKVMQVISSIAGSFQSKTKSEESINLSLKIISKSFGIINIEVQKTDSGRMVKEKVLEKTENKIEEINKFKLIRVKTIKPFEDLKTLEELKVQSNEEFLLIPRRDPIINWNEDKIIASPTERQITEKTADIPVSLSPQLPAFSIYALLQDDDMRKVFVTLAQEASYILGATPFAVKLIAYYRKRIHNYIENHKNAKKVLNELGFPMDRVERAMMLKADNAKAALDWLIKTTKQTPTSDLDASPRSSLVTSARHDSILSYTFEPTHTNQEGIDGLLEIVKFYADKDEIVYQDNINVMFEMGYETKEAYESLRLVRNNVAAAVAYIQGDKNPSIMELRNGLSETSDVRKKFLESVEIQRSLSNPDSFLLFVSILDNPSQANSWSPFSEIGSLMTHIIVTYHEQKHVTATNQFNESRIPISALSAPN